MMNVAENVASDIPKGGWVDRWFPASTRPYLRLARFDRPIGAWLLLLPCWWSVALASPGWPALSMMALFAIGAFVMRGAGCTLNDIADREFDARVARTADRPIPSGAVSVGQAVMFMSLLLAVGLAVVLQFNLFAIQVGIASLALVAIYPFMKRVTYWPQMVLGLTFNWGALLGWAAVRGDLAWPAFILYAAGLFWTLGYDTIYALQDKEDDPIVGVKSSALKLLKRIRPWLVVFYAITLGLVGWAGYLEGLHPVFFVFLTLSALHLGWQVRTLDIHNPKDCLSKFKSNRDFGLILLAGLILGRVLV